MARGEIVFRQGLRDFNRGQRTNYAIVVAAFGHTVDVRAEEQRLESPIAARAAADNVPGGVDRNIELRLLHQAKHIFAATPIGFTVSEPADAALRVLAKLSEGVEVLADARAIHSQLLLRERPDRERPRRKRARSSQQSDVELSTIHKRRHTSRKTVHRLRRLRRNEKVVCGLTLPIL